MGYTTNLNSAAPEGGAIAALREISVFLVVVGVALMVVGLLAVGCSLSATMATVMVFGVLLVVGAVIQVVAALWGRSWRGFVLHLLAGFLYLIAGLFMIDNPLAAAVSLTLLVAGCLLVGGVLRVILSLLERFDGWGWVLLNGVVSTALGAAIWRQWPWSGLWVIGLFVGIEMILSGLSWLTLGIRLRCEGKTAAST